MKELVEFNENLFDSIKHVDDNENEYWLARELQVVLEYKEWRWFSSVIEKAQVACSQSGNNINFNFGVYSKIVNTGVSTKPIIDYRLSRYACYLIVQNSNPKLKVVALGQTYFAIQTRKQELLEAEYELLSEDEKRLYNRDLTRKGNYALNQAAKKAGAKNMDKFHNAGYKGLYNGETANDIAKRKGLRYREDILDNMGSEELADNIFRITLTKQKIKNENIKGEDSANKAHNVIGKNIRKFIKENGGTIPEDLPTPKVSLKEIERHNNKKIKDKNN